MRSTPLPRRDPVDCRPSRSPVRLGGNGLWGFYGVDLGRRYLTIPIRYDLDRKIRVLTWYYS